MKQYILLFLVLLIASCKDTKVLDYEIPEDLDVPTYPISLDEGRRGLRYSDLFSDVEYVHLETTEQSLVGSINKLVVADNGDLIVLDGSLTSVIRFDRNGKYMCHIGRCGHGHGEFITAKDVVYDKYHDQVLVLDVSSSKVNIYDMNGKFQSSVQLDFPAMTFTVVNDEYLCFYLNHYDDLSKNPVGHNIKITNREGCVMTELMEYDATMNLFHPNIENTFFQLGSKTCFKQPYSSLIYSIEGGTAGVPTFIPEMHFDFGEYKIPQEWYRIDFDEMMDKFSKMDGAMYLTSVYKVGDRLFLNIHTRSSNCIYILNLQDRTLDKYNFGANNDMSFGSGNQIVNIKDNRCYFIFSPLSFSLHKELIDKEGAQFYTVDEEFKQKEYIPTQKDRDLLNAIHEGDNPIIQVCTLKD